MPDVDGNVPLFGTPFDRQQQDPVIGEPTDPLGVEIKDEILAQTIDRRIKQSQKHWDSDEVNLKVRRQKNLDFLEGRQVDAGKQKNYTSTYVDNVIWEAERTLKPIALSRLPDLLVKPADDTNEESKTNAENLTSLVNSDVRKRENRKVLGLAYRHRPVYFQGVIKHRWNPMLGDGGDYQFEAINPENIVVDHTAISNDVNDMDFVAHRINDKSVKEIINPLPYCIFHPPPPRNQSS